MPPAPTFTDVMRFESELVEGDECVVRWTNCGSAFQGYATVVRVNRASIRARLLEPVGEGYACDGVRVWAYPVGREIRVPRTWAGSWSWNNGVFPR